MRITPLWRPAARRLAAALFAAGLLAAAITGCFRPPGGQPPPAPAGPGLSARLPEGWTAAATGPASARWRLPGGSRVDLFVQPLGRLTLAEYAGYTARYLGAGPAPHLAPIAPVPGGGPRRPEWIELAWRRTPLGPDDLSVSHLIHVPDGATVYTLILRTRPEAYDQLRPRFRQVAASLRADPAGGVPGAPGAAGSPEPPLPDAAGAPEPPLPDAAAVVAAHRGPAPALQVHLPPDGVLWGLFDGSAPFAWESLAAREARLDHRFGLIMAYRDWTDPFPLAEARAAAADGRLLLMTWQPWHEGKLPEPLILPEVAAGRHDAYVRRFARDAAAFGQPVLIRFANGMNGDWAPWSAWFYGLDHDVYVAAWRRVHDLFAAEGATNVMWVWNPHHRSYPPFAWNDPHLYYPGDAYVDWVGLTGYNTGPRSGDPWRSFDEIFGPVYADYRRRYPDKPLLIAEVASDDQGGDKAAWIRDMLQALPQYPAIRMAVWFDYPWWNWNYPLDSGPDALAAFAAGLRQPYYQAPSVSYDDP